VRVPAHALVELVLVRPLVLPAVAGPERAR
jgi:hypothetical protein